MPLKTKVFNRLFHYLASSDIWTLEVGVEQEVEVERDVLARVVDANVHVKFFLPEDETVAHSEGAVPHGAGVIRVCQTEDGLDVTGVEAVRALFQLPSREK